MAPVYSGVSSHSLGLNPTLPSQPPSQLLLWFAFAFKAVFPAFKPLDTGAISVISSVGIALPGDSFPPQNTGKLTVTPDLKCLS